MAEFGQFLGPAIANAGQTFQNYYDDRIRKKREEQVLGLQMQRQAQQDQLAVNQDRREQQRFDADMKDRGLKKAVKPFASREELRLAILTGQYPDPDGGIAKELDRMDEEDFKQQRTLRSISNPEGGGQAKQPPPILPGVMDDMNQLRTGAIASGQVWQSDLNDGNGKFTYSPGFQPPSDSALASRALIHRGFQPGTRQYDSLHAGALGKPFPPPQPTAQQQAQQRLFPNGRFQNPYQQPVLGNPPAGGNSGLIRLPDGSELTPEEYQMAKAAGLI